MSIASFTSNKNGVQDLLAALPAPKPSTIERSRSESLEREPKPGFNEFLRDSAEQQAPKRAESAEPVDAKPRAESQQGEKQAATEQSGAVESDPVKNESSESETQDSAGEKTSEQDKAQASTGNSETKATDAEAEAQVQAAAVAATAQLNVVQAVATDTVKTQVEAKATQSDDTAKVVQSNAKSQSTAANQSAAANLLANGSLPNQSQASNGPVVQTEAAVTVQALPQQGDATQSGTGDTSRESKSASTTSTTATTTASTNSNAAVTTAFSVADQGGGEARMPVSTTGTTPSADASRVTQAQVGSLSADNDSLNTARLTRGLANAVQQRGGAVTLRLTPPEMGTVRIQMQITGTNVSATFHAESASAQTLLTTQLAQLRTALESKGMSVERLSVQPLAATAQTNNANQSQNQGDAQQQGQSQQQSAGDGRSRGQYSGGSSGQQSSEQQSSSGNQQAARGFFDRLSDASELEGV